MLVYFITQKISHSVDIVGDKHLTANCQFYKVKVELLSRLLQDSTHALSHWTA